MVACFCLKQGAVNVVLKHSDIVFVRDEGDSSYVEVDREEKSPEEGLIDNVKISKTFFNEMFPTVAPTMKVRNCGRRNAFQLTTCMRICVNHGSQTINLESTGRSAMRKPEKCTTRDTHTHNMHTHIFTRLCELSALHTCWTKNFSIRAEQQS